MTGARRLRVSPTSRVQEVMVVVGDHTVRLRFNPRKGSRRLCMRMKTDHLSITGPWRSDLSSALAFMKEQAQWIVDHLPPPHEPFPTPFVTDRLLHAGVHVPLTWKSGTRPQIQMSPSGCLITLPDVAPARWPGLLRSLFIQHWSDTIHQSLGQDLSPCVAALGRGPSKVRVRPVKSIWGSLDSRDRITLDLALALAPPATLRYVWIHELCHLRERNHSAKFWAWVDRFCLDRKPQQAWLKGQDGHRIKAQVAAWLDPQVASI